MGNVLGHESAAGILDAETIEDDLKWLAVQGSMVFNDDFLEEEYANLPEYEGTEMNPEPGKGAGTGDQGSDRLGAFRDIADGPISTQNADFIRRMLQLLGSQGNTTSSGVGLDTGTGGRGTSVEDFPPLLGESSLSESTHATAARMRARLFQRMHLALLRQAFRAMKSQEGVAGTGSRVTTAVGLSAFAQPPSASTQDTAESDSSAIMISASMRVSLTIMTALRGTCAGLFVNIAQTLMDILGASSPFALGQLGESSAYMETLSHIRSVAKGAAAADAGHSKEERAQAMALLLSLGLATGSLSDLICVAEHLLEVDAPPLPCSAGPFLKRLQNHSILPKAVIPRALTWTASFSARLETPAVVNGESRGAQGGGSRTREQQGGGRVSVTATGAVACNPATDGEYVYIWEASSRAIHKVGTGFHGTLAGNVYRCRKNILNDIRMYKGMEPFPPDENDEHVEDGEDNARDQEIPRGEQESIPMPVDPGFAPALGRRAMMGTGRGIGGGDDGSGNSPLDVNASGSWGRYNDDTVDSNDDSDDYGFAETMEVTGPGAFTADDERAGTEPTYAGSRIGGVRGPSFLLSSPPSAQTLAVPQTVAGGRLLPFGTSLRHSVASSSFSDGDGNGDDPDGDDSNLSESSDGMSNSLESGSPDDNWPGPLSREPVARTRQRSAGTSRAARLGSIQEQRLPTPHPSGVPTPQPTSPSQTPPRSGSRLPGTEGSAGTRASSSRGRGQGASPASMSRADSPPRTVDEFLRSEIRTIGTMDSRVRIGATIPRPMESGEMAGTGRSSWPVIRAGLIRFRAVLERPLLPQIPESGHPDDYNVEEATSFPTMEEQDEGEVWMHKVVHGFRWYKVRVVSRLDSDQLLNEIGWVPLFGCDFSDWGSMNTVERMAEIEGEEIVELVDPATGDVMDVDSPRAVSPPVWEGVEDVEEIVHDDQNSRREARTSRFLSSFVRDGSVEVNAPLRPVWLALVGSKLFFRDKASGALSTDEIAVLRPSDLSLESVISLIDLPISGFPITLGNVKCAPITSREGGEEETKAGAGDLGDGTADGSRGAKDGDRGNSLVELTSFESGSRVVEYSSNPDVSDEVLQRILGSGRQAHASGGDSAEPSANTVFAFAADDTERSIVVKLGHAEFVREAGVVLVPVPDVETTDVIGSLLVETSCDGRTWTKLEQWDAPNEEYLGMDVEGEEEPPHCVQVAVSTGNEHIAKFLRYSLALPYPTFDDSLVPGLSGSRLPPRCFLSNVWARGPLHAAQGDAVPINDIFEIPPFPAMTTDSRHVILVHTTTGVSDEENGHGKDKKKRDVEAEDRGRRLKLNFLDPEDGYRLVRTVTLDWDMEEALLHRQGLLCDGARLIMLGPTEATVPRTKDTNVIHMRCRCGPLEPPHGESRTTERYQDQQEDMEFDCRRPGGLAPHGLAYDRRNNILWGWDPVLSKLCRWRCDGLSPIFAPPRPSRLPVAQSSARTAPDPWRLSTPPLIPTNSQAHVGREEAKTGDTSRSISQWLGRVAWIQSMLTSRSAAHRVEALEEAGRCEESIDGSFDFFMSASRNAGRHAALILGYLERLGEPYGPPAKPAAESRARCELEAASGGSEDGSFSRLLVRGEDWSCKEAGINVLVLTESLDAGGELARSFAVQESRNAADRLADYLNSVPQGRTVMIAVQDDAAGNLTNSAKRALLSLGTGHDEVSALGVHKRSSFALIGRKGAKPGSVPQVLRLSKKGYATVRQRLPAPKVPMCVDTSRESLHSLITLILQHQSYLLQHPKPLSSNNASSQPAGHASVGKSSTGVVYAPELQGEVVLSAVNILTNQIYQLLRGATPFQALDSFCPNYLARLLALLLAVIDQDRPFTLHPEEASQPAPSPEQREVVGDAANSRVSVQGGCTTESRSGITPSVQEESTVAAKGRDDVPEPGSRKAIIRVSCMGKGSRSSRLNADKRRVALSVVTEGMMVVRMKVLLQEACLRLFVTGMDLFYPSCEERCNLLTLYLTKYLSDGLSPARETVLELFLRRMSEPAQLVELMYSRSANSTNARGGLEARESESSSPFIIQPGSMIGVAGVAVPQDARVRTTSGVDSAASRGLCVEKPSVSDTQRAASHAPTILELQSLLLKVAIAEGIEQVKAMGGDTPKHGRSRSAPFAIRGLQGVGGGKIGQAAVEMLGRLTNQALSGAACIIMESDFGAFDKDLDDLGGVLAELGMPPIPVPSTASTACDPDVSGIGIHAETAKEATVVGGKEGGETKDKRWLSFELSAAITLVVLVTSMCRSCAALAKQAVETVDQLAGIQESSGKGVVSQELDQLLQRSPLGALLPMLASALTLLVDKHGKKLQGYLSDMAREVVGVMTWVSQLLERVPAERRAVSITTRSAGTMKRVVVMESKHNYEPNTDEMIELNIPGASRMTIVFDSHTSTEDGYDFVIFWKDVNRREIWHPAIPKFSGSGESCNFPGFGGRPPLIIESSRAWVQWKTDQSNEDWGWRFTATADVGKPSSGGDGGGYWLLGLDRQLAGAGAALAGCLIISMPWGGTAEDDNAPWMEDDLLAGARGMSHAAAVASSPLAVDSTSVVSSPLPAVAIGEGASAVGLEVTEKPQQSRQQTDDGVAGMAGETSLDDSSHQLSLLMEVVARLEGTGGTKLCQAMRAKVLEDQGSVEAINHAVYATCAALIWHQGLGTDALALVEGRVSTPSKALTKTWRFGQQMRQYFDYGDVRDAVDSQIELQRQQAITTDPSLRRAASANSIDEPSQTTRPILTRGPSVYQGAEEKVIAEVSERMVSRALFLLNLPSQAERASRRENSKRRWGLLGKVGGIGRTSSQSYMAEGAELLETWGQVIDEATAMHKLKSILAYRRKAADMRERAKKDSVGERIMKFVQCPADVSELELIRHSRDQRASLRAKGLQVTRALIAAAASPPSKAWLLASHAQSIRLAKRDDRPGAHVHYLSCVEGCAPTVHLHLARQFAQLVIASLDILKGCSRPKKGETRAEAAERRDLAVSALQALAIDYDLGDHDILKGSILLEVLEPLLEGFNEPGVAGSVPVTDYATTRQSAHEESSAPHLTGISRDHIAHDEVGNGEEKCDGGDGDGGSDEGDDGGYEGDEDVATGSDDGEHGYDLSDDLDDSELMKKLEEELEDEDLDHSRHLPGGEEETVRMAAWCLFEVLLPRCVGLEGQGLETRLEEPTGFSRRLLDVLVRQVGRASANVQRSNISLGIGNSPDNSVNQSYPPTANSAHQHGRSGENPSGDSRESKSVDSTHESAMQTPMLSQKISLLSHGMRLRRDEPGRAAPHIPLGMYHTISLWLRRDSCPLDASPGLWYSPVKLGDFVARGPRWPMGNMADGGPGGLGKVVDVIKSENMVRVEWEVTGERGTYNMGSVDVGPADGANAIPASVDELLVYEVVKVDPSIGGNILMKGAWNNLSDDERTLPWRQFGLLLQGNGTLMYYGMSGDHVFAVHSSTMVQPDTWTHVAIVLAKNTCRIHIDGEQETEVDVPSHMLNAGVVMKKGVVESQHPYSNNLDKVWEVNVEGAVSYTITFDCMTKTEVPHDYVIIVKEREDIDNGIFGQLRYSGGHNRTSSNWPGLGGRPPLVINAPRFFVCFHTDQSTCDWGFKLTYSALIAAPGSSTDQDDEVSSADLNAFPVYLGQPPGDISSQPSAKGYLWRVSTCAGALTTDQIRTLARNETPPEPVLMEERACTDVLSLVQRCASSTDGVISQAGGLGLEAGASPLVSPQVLGPLLVLLLQGSFRLRLAAGRLCEKLLPQAPLEMVQVQLSRAGLASSSVPAPLAVPNEGIRIDAAPLVRALMLTLGETLSVWTKPAAMATLGAGFGKDDQDCNGVKQKFGFCPSDTLLRESRPTGEEALALAGAHVGLLRALFTEERWSAALADHIREACSNLPRVVKSLEEAGSSEIAGGDEEAVAKALCDSSLWMAHALFALLGGGFQGVHVGGRALALLGDGESSTVERCTVLSMEWPRPYLKKAEKRQASGGAIKSTAEFVVSPKEWSGLNTLGDAVVVCLHAEPDRPRVLPRARVSPDDAPPSTAFLSALESPPFVHKSPSRDRACNESNSAESGGQGSGQAETPPAGMQEANTPEAVSDAHHGLITTLVEAFGVLSAADSTDNRERYKPLVVETMEERILESPHPHDRAADEVFPLEFPGAESIQLIFDEDCRTEEGVAYIRIYKDEGQTAIWGEEMYHGRDKDANWPGVDGRPNVCVPAPSCVIKFHAEDRNPDWGYRITARAKCKSYTEPPERPPLWGVSALSTLQACGSKALLSLVKSWPQFLPHALPLIKPLARGALSDVDLEQDKKRSPVVQRIVLETDHPYAHNADRKEMVKIEGARKLIVSFDERTRTESGCDYLTFFADETMGTTYGDHRYTGGKDGNSSNWPGMDGRPPLEIPTGHFFFRWMTDGSVNDWGWKMTVTAVLGKVEPADLPLPLLESKMAALLRVCHDCPKEQPPAMGLEKFETKTAPLAHPPSLYGMLGLPTRPDSQQSPRAPSAPPVFDKEWYPGSPGGKGRVGSPDVSRASWSLAAETRMGNSLERPFAVEYINPRVFVVNARDAEEVPLLAKPNRSAPEVGKIVVNNPVIATEEDGDWLRVIPARPYTSEETCSTKPASVSTWARSVYGTVPSGFTSTTEDTSVGPRSTGSTATIEPRWSRKVESLPGFSNTFEWPYDENSFPEGEKSKVDPSLLGKVNESARFAKRSSTLQTVPEERREWDTGAEEQQEMWALRRQGDMLYLVPEEEVLSHLITIPDEESSRHIGDGWRSRQGRMKDNSTEARGTTFHVVDPPVDDETGAASQGAFRLSVGEEIAVDCDRLWSALAETSRATTSIFSRLALTTILAGWEDDVALIAKGCNPSSRFSLDTFGGPQMFLNILRTTFAEERRSKCDTENAALKVLKKKILDAAKGKTEEGRKIVNLLVAYSLHQLRSTIILAEYLCPTKAVLRTWETPHSYANNTDSFTKIRIPGAKRIRILFDEKCSTEMGHDFVRIYKDSHHTAFWGAHKYHGPAVDRNRIWAGVGDRPPLTVEADHFEVYFHSDSNNNDWGARLFAYGIMQEPSAEERADRREKQKEFGNPETEMACWLLEALAQDADGDYAKSILYQRGTLETLVRFLESGDNKGKIWVVHLLTAMLLDINKHPSPSRGVPPHGETVSDAPKLALTGNPREVLVTAGLAPKLRKLADEQDLIEASRVLAPRSPLLQALAQACVMADCCLRNSDYRGSIGQSSSSSEEAAGGGRSPPEDSENTADARWPATHPPHTSNFVETRENGKMLCVEGGNVRIGSTVIASPGYQGSRGGARWIRWHVRVHDHSTMGAGPSVGVRFSVPLADSDQMSETGEDSWLLTWSSHGRVFVEKTNTLIASKMFGPNVVSGDVVTVEVDKVHKSVRFYRNQAFVGIALGPMGCGAALAHDDVAFHSGDKRTPNSVTKEGWPDECYIHVAVTLRGTGHEVELVPSPSSSLSLLDFAQGTERSSMRKGSGGWMCLVKECSDLLTAVTKRELPRFFVMQELIPKYQQHATVYRESDHPLPAPPSTESITIPGATALEVSFDPRTVMGHHDRITIFSKDALENPVRVIVGLEGGTDPLAMHSGGIGVGDRVVRGPSWDWGAGQDGGPGGLGTVVDIKAWKGKPRAGIKVWWDDTVHDGLYRWDYEGCFDLLVVGQGERSTKPAIVPGDTVLIDVNPDEQTFVPGTMSDCAWEGALLVKTGGHLSIKLPRGGEGSLSMSGEFSLEGWFLLVAEANKIQGGVQPLFSRGIIKGISQIDVRAIANADRSQADIHVEMRAGDQSSGLSLRGGALLPGVWAHVAFAIDGTGQAKLIVDGEAVATGNFAGPRMVIEECDLVVGASLESEKSFLIGNVYDIRIWSKALFAREVGVGSKALPPAGANGLLANFPLRNKPGWTLENRGSCKDIVLHEVFPELICWDPVVGPPAMPSHSRWGWACSITPIYDPATLSELPELLGGTFRELYGAGDIRHDLALVRYVNSFAERKAFDASRLLRCTWEDMTPKEEDLVREPLLRELTLWPASAKASSVNGATAGDSSSFQGGVRGDAPTREDPVKVGGEEPKSPRSPMNDAVDTGVEESKGESVRPQVTRDGKVVGAGGGDGGDKVGLDKPRKGRTRCIAARFELLQLLNMRLRTALPYFDLHQMDRKWSVAALLSSCRGLIFEVVKTAVLESALDETAFKEGGQFDLRLSRAKAAKHIHAGHTDVEGRWSVFGQAFRQIHTMHPRALRTDGKLYNCFFMGERAQDAGGPYRESWSMYAQELQSTALPLLIRTPNAKHAAGMGRDNYVPNPGANSSTQVEMFVFLGKLMGHAIRSKEYLGLNLSGVVWKALVGQEVNREDLEGVDVLLTKSMQDIRTIHQQGVTPSMFPDIVLENFTTLSLDDTKVELRPGGRSTPVTWENRLEYADLVESHRLAECCSMVKHIRKGLSMVVPLAVLGMFTGEEVERIVCGKPEVDIGLLEAVTEYSGCRREQPHIRLFWQALREFTPEERSMLVKFTWGRTRLPLTAEGFSQRFKLQSFGRTPPDDYLPVAHTCFFSLELPAYSSLEVMKERLRNAIYNCQAIDGDDTFAGMQAAAMGWDWQEEEE